MANSPHTNRLIESTSPYLLQHAHNPVDWWPWGQEAFEEARRRDVPIFLSIGYSTCYWCHVMERESFESTRVAALLNQHFVCIKIDREERPDVDDIYMAATLISNGHGGWPMSIFLEPQRLRPFYCGTYFPAEPRPGLGSMPTLPQLVEGLSNAWTHKRDEVMQAADSLAEAVSEELTRRHEPAALDAQVVEKAVAALLSVFDRSHGGFGGKPKFPQAVNLEFLFTVREHTQDQTTRAAIDHALRFTLDRMACGGIFDQIGGGFHRYAVDQIWLVPHFEKMLYDNAQLLPLYAMAAATYANPDDERIARLIVSYIDREMTAPDGAFYSAQDAEVDGREGKNYLWTPEKIREALGENANAAIRIYRLDGHPNFRDPHHPDEPASHVLHLQDMPTRLADQSGIARDEWLAQLTAINAALLKARDRRKQPRLDDKVLASWNGLMISGLARAAEYLKDAELLKRAQRAAMAVRDRLIDTNGVLLRCSRDGKAHTPGFLEDYAMVAQGLTSIVRAARALEHDASQELKLALDLATRADALFSAPDGGFFDVSEEQTDLFVRPRTTYDGALPTGQAVMLHAMLDLAEFTDDSRWLERAMSHLRALSGQVSSGSVASINSTRALLRVLLDPKNAARAAQFGPVTAQPVDAVQEQGIGFTPVEVYADRDSIDVGPGLPGEIWLELQIAPGFHIVAAEPVDAEIGASLIPLRVFLLAGDGLAVYADYPPGESYTDDGLMVYRDAVTIRVAVEHAGASSGNHVLGVRFQACDDMSCRLPTTVELDVAINLVHSNDA